MANSPLTIRKIPSSLAWTPTSKVRMLPDSPSPTSHYSCTHSLWSRMTSFSLFLEDAAFGSMSSIPWLSCSHRRCVLLTTCLSIQSPFSKALFQDHLQCSSSCSSCIWVPIRADVYTFVVLALHSGLLSFPIIAYLYSPHHGERKLLCDMDCVIDIFIFHMISHSLYKYSKYFPLNPFSMRPLNLIASLWEWENKS